MLMGLPSVWALSSDTEEGSPFGLAWYALCSSVSEPLYSLKFSTISRVVGILAVENDSPAFDATEVPAAFVAVIFQ